jgi:hypothetical protein
MMNAYVLSSSLIINLSKNQLIIAHKPHLMPAQYLVLPSNLDVEFLHILWNLN